jgi:preprotein translocase subunit YajC
MKLEQATKQRIIKNALLSLFIYVLPLALMFVTFYFTGQRPWEKKQHTNQNVKPLTNKKTLSNDIND